MRFKARNEIPLAALAVVFTIGLTYASVELPRRVNALLHARFVFPGNDPFQEPALLEKFISSNHLHLLGYGSLVILLCLIVIGFFAEKRGLAAAGGIGFFLPVFGHFCRSMFFLAGLGLMRAAWLPITDVSFDLLRMGDIVYLPYAIVVYLPALVGVDVRGPLPYAIMGLGILLFVMGVLLVSHPKSKAGNG